MSNKSESNKCIKGRIFPDLSFMDSDVEKICIIGLYEGKNFKQIASDLRVAERTAKFFYERILLKYRCNSFESLMDVFKQKSNGL